MIKFMMMVMVMVIVMKIVRKFVEVYFFIVLERIGVLMGWWKYV